VTGLGLFATAAWALLREGDGADGASADGTPAGGVPAGELPAAGARGGPPGAVGGASEAVRVLVLAERFSYNRWVPSMAWAPVAAVAEERAPGRIAALRAELGGLTGAALERAALAALRPGQTRLE
jgi:hypothetical protein